jgi:carbonic anhydrase/acetyltransferase-like protein (isoleucine patch superfamily)
MLYARCGAAPNIHPDARIAPTASIVGDVAIGAGAYVDHHVLVASAGPRIVIGDDAVILAGTVIRSVGGETRPGYGVEVGTGTLVSPRCVLTGCRLGANCYIATGVVVLQGARIADHGRLAIGAVVHAGVELAERARVGLGHVVVPTQDGYLDTADMDAAREALRSADFFDLAFGDTHTDQAERHRIAIQRIRDEARGWTDSEMSSPENDNATGGGGVQLRVD